MEFIHRRFNVDCHWLDGNCYYFSIILKERFGGEVYYDSTLGHFFLKIGKLNYDYNGLYEPISEQKLSMIKSSDATWYERLHRDCIE